MGAAWIFRAAPVLYRGSANEKKEDYQTNNTLCHTVCGFFPGASLYNGLSAVPWDGAFISWGRYA